MTTVVSVRGQKPAAFLADPRNVYIGDRVRFTEWQRSIWYNRHHLLARTDRPRAIALYEAELMERPDLLDRLPELRGKRLGCWCKDEPDPLACHGDVLARLADGPLGDP